MSEGCFADAHRASPVLGLSGHGAVSATRKRRGRVAVSVFSTSYLVCGTASFFILCLGTRSNCRIGFPLKTCSFYLQKYTTTAVLVRTKLTWYCCCILQLQVCTECVLGMNYPYLCLCPHVRVPGRKLPLSEESSAFQQPQMHIRTRIIRTKLF